MLITLFTVPELEGEAQPGDTCTSRGCSRRAETLNREAVCARPGTAVGGKHR